MPSRTNRLWDYLQNLELTCILAQTAIAGGDKMSISAICPASVNDLSGNGTRNWDNESSGI